MLKFLVVLQFLLPYALFAQTASSDIEPYRKTSTEKHEMRVINSGIGSLYARVDMIRRAKKSIDLETFIFNPDKAGKIILKELAEAAKRGVKVRILVDKSPTVFEMDEHIAKMLKENNIEVRYYNAASIFKISSVQFRNHRKLMVRDGEEAITGGRNIADEYFDLSKEFNFLDRDITVEGEVVKSMDQTFDNFWNSKIVEIPGEPRKPTQSQFGKGGDPHYHQQKLKFARRKKLAASLLAPDAEIDKLIQLVELHGKENLEKNQKRICPEVAFASDREGAKFSESLNNKEYHEKYRFLRQEIAKWMDLKIKDEVILDTPYFLDNTFTHRLLGYLSSKKAKVKLFTNSLASTDALPIATVFGNSVTAYTSHEGFGAFVYKGKYSQEEKIHDKEVENATWGTHSKSMVFSDDAFMIGSFNFDNRSEYYNTELALFCSGSPELTADVKNNIQLRMDNSFKLNTNGDIEDCDATKDVSAFKQMMYYLLKVPSHMFQNLL